LRGAPFSLRDPLAVEVTEIRIARQFGISYLPLIVMKERHLAEQAVVEADLPSALGPHCSMNATIVRDPSRKRPGIAESALADRGKLVYFIFQRQS
jgi:hypothetical protein